MNYTWSIHPTAGQKFELRCNTEFEHKGKMVPVQAGEWYNPSIQNPEALKEVLVKTIDKQINLYKAGGE